MIPREAYTRIFLEEAEVSTDAANIELHLQKWWKYYRSGDIGGLRLSEEGFSFLVDTLKLKTYEVPFHDKIDQSPTAILFFDKNMKTPYYITDSGIYVFIEKEAFKLHLFSDDVKKLGLVKAMKNQQENS
jgi:hypothetical protein